MNWSYRGFTADAKGSLPRFSYVPQRVGASQIGIRVTIDIQTQLIGDTQSEIESRIEEFQRECSRDGGDFRYFYPNSTNSVQSLLSSQTVGGVRVVKAPSYENPSPGEHSIFRNASVTFGALIPVAGLTAGAIISLDETIDLDNPRCKPDRFYVPLKNAPAAIVQPRAYGIAVMRQAGSVVVAGRYAGIGNLPIPRFPSNHVQVPGADVYRYPAPVRVEGIPIGFRTDYSYVMQFNRPIAGNYFPAYV